MFGKEIEARHNNLKPSTWVELWTPLIPRKPAGRVLDVACGTGRHTRHLLDAGHCVTAVDRDTSGVDDLADNPKLRILRTDLEKAYGWPFSGQQFEGIVVTNYLHRPILGSIVAAVAPGGALIYETFAVGNEIFGRPTNPDFLLRNDELIEITGERFRIVAYEHGEIRVPRPAIMQRVAAVRSQQGQGSPRLNPD